MSKKVNYFIPLLVFAILFLSNTTATAKKGGFISFGGEAMAKVVDFPDTEIYQDADGAYFDAGALYKQVTILFIPIWNYDIRWCGYIESEEYYIEVDKTTLDEYATEAGVELPANPSIPFWDAFGGKLVFLLLIGAFVAYSILSPDEEEEESTTPTDEAPTPTAEGENKENKED